jgi:hypothetical protein
MKITLQLLLLAAICLACGSGDTSDFGIEPNFVAYNDEAPVLRKIYCNDAKCETPHTEDRNTYDSEGRLVKIENLSRSSSGSLELQSYTEQFFDVAGLLTKKIQYNKHALLPGWVTYYETTLEYESGLLKLEKTYFTNHQPEEKVLTGSVLYEYKNGRKSGQKWLDNKNNFIRRVEYGYINNVVNLETWYDDKDNVIRIFEHKFSGKRRQIGEYLLNSKDLLAMVERTYDSQGRLATQETKVNNPLLCAMMPGVIRYSY